MVDGLAVPPDPYVRTLLEHAAAGRDEADRRIAAASANWPLERMAVIDRLVLRLAVAELLDPDGPPDGGRHRRGGRAGQGLLDRRVRRLRQRHPLHHRRRHRPASVPGPHRGALKSCV